MPRFRSIGTLWAGLMLSQACAFSPPTDAEPHARLQLMVTASQGNHLEAAVYIDGERVDEQLLAKGTFNIAPGPHSLRVEILSAHREVGQIHRTYSLNNAKTRKVRLTHEHRCRGGVMLKFARDARYELYLSSTAPQKRCLIECRRFTDANDPLDHSPCAMTRRY